MKNLGSHRITFLNKRHSQSYTDKDALKPAVVSKGVTQEQLNNMNKQSMHLRCNSNILGAYLPNTTRQSLYQSSYQGLVSPTQVKSMGNFFTTSSSTGVMIPNPKLIKAMSNRIAKFKIDCEAVKSKIEHTLSQKQLSTVRNFEAQNMGRLSFHHFSNI